MKTAFCSAEDPASGNCGGGGRCPAPSSSQSLSSGTQILGEEASCDSNKVIQAKTPPRQLDSEAEGAHQEVSEYAEAHLPLGGARSWSCSEGTIGHATVYALSQPLVAASPAGKRSRRSSFDSADAYQLQRVHSLQNKEAQKRKWAAIKREGNNPETVSPGPASQLLEETELWEDDVLRRSFDGSFGLKREQGEAFVGPLQRSQSVKSPMSRKGSAARNRTSKYIGVGSSNRKNQWQARILVHGKVTHLGYYQSEEEAAMVYDRVAVSLNGPEATTNFPAKDYVQAGGGEFFGLGREDLQRALGVKPMDKSSRFRGVSRKKGKWEAKVMVNRKWAYRALFDSEDEAAHAYDAAVRRLKPREASSFVNFGIEDSLRKRPSLTVLPASRSKSQKLRSKSAKRGLKRQPNSFPNMLDLDEAHIPPACLDLDPPPTPTRQNSLQPPLSPVSGSTRATMASALMSSSLYADLSSSASFTTEPLPLPLQSATNSPISQRCSSMGQLSVTMPLAGTLSLPDPNSIGVPPPDNLPFPELVKTPFSSAAAPEGMLSRNASTAHLPSHGTNPTGATRTLSQASSLHSSLTLPEIPLPILEPSAIGPPPESLALGGDSYFASTPLSQQLGQTFAHNQQAHRQELQKEASPQQLSQNPFQEASRVLPPITNMPATPRRTSSSGGFPPLHPRTGSLKTLKSMPESEALQVAPHSLAEPFASQGVPSPLPRAFSEGLPLGGTPGDVFDMQGQASPLPQQMSAPSCSTLKEALMLGHPLPASGPSVRFSSVREVIPGPGMQPEHQDIACGLSEETLPIGPDLGGADLPDLSSTDLPFLHNMQPTKRERRTLFRSMSALPSLPQLMEGAGVDGGNRNADAEVIGDNAIELLDGLLRENVPTESQGVQIGGEYLHAFDTLDMVDEAYILGRT